MISKYLDCSIGHITETDLDILHMNDKNTQFPVRIIEHGYGVWVNVVAENAEDQADRVLEMKNGFGMSEDFCNLYEFAVDHDCNWINLDMDADTIPDLPTFDW